MFNSAVGCGLGLFLFESDLNHVLDGEFSGNDNGGVVVNDSLVLIDFFNQKRNEGLGVHDAIMTAGIQRFRPIVLTTLTTFGGLLPMIFEQSRQARFLIPMAISLGFGILFATFITLLLIPSLTLILEDLGNLRKRLVGLTDRTDKTD